MESKTMSRAAAFVSGMSVPKHSVLSVPTQLSASALA
jgi:hypothetical protein